MNFRIAFEAGQKGSNKGLPMGEGLKAISQAINGIQRGRVYTVAAAPKGGKSTMVDIGFCIEPALYVMTINAKLKASMEAIVSRLANTTDPETRETLNHQYENLNSQLIDVEFIYNSYEIDRISKEFDFVAHFLNSDFGIYQIFLPPGKFYKGNNFVYLSSAFLKGELEYDTQDPDASKEIIRVPEDIIEKIKIVYKTRIIPLFGEYNERGEKISKGLIKFLEIKDNPTGVRNYLIEYAKENGEFLYKQTVKDGQTFTRMIGYKPHNPKKYVIIITDHLRKLLPERGFKPKETVDKFSEYAVEFRNTCNFTFVHIIHLNRSVSDIGRRQYDDDRLFPQSDDIKETGERNFYITNLLYLLYWFVLIFIIYLYNKNLTKMEVKIYVLCDPITCKIRYIGRTKSSLEKRLSEHISKSKNYQKYNPDITISHKVRWINSLVKRGIKPQIRLLTTVQGWKESHISERQLINKYKDKYNLVNSEDRGEGHKNKSVTLETRQKIKRALKNHYSNEENKTNFYNKIYCYTLEGVLYKEYLSTKFAAKDLNIPILHITNMINTFDNKRGKRKPKYGFYFSKNLYEVFPVVNHNKVHDNWLNIKIVNKNTQEEQIFNNALAFKKEFNLSDWDLSQMKKNLTKKVKQLQIENDILINEILLPS